MKMRIIEWCDNQSWMVLGGHAGQNSNSGKEPERSGGQPPSSGITSDLNLNLSHTIIIDRSDSNLKISSCKW